MKQKLFFPIFILFLGVIVFQNSCTKDQGKLPAVLLCDSLNVKFSTDINPIIQTNCVKSGCHTSADMAGGFDFSQGYSQIDTARLRARALDGNPSYMPPTGELPLLERQKIECWLKDKAPNN